MPAVKNSCMLTVLHKRLTKLSPDTFVDSLVNHGTLAIPLAQIKNCSEGGAGGGRAPLHFLIFIKICYVSYEYALIKQCNVLNTLIEQSNFSNTVMTLHFLFRT